MDTVAVPDGPENCVVFVLCVPLTLMWNVTVDDDWGKSFRLTEASLHVTVGGPVASWAAAGNAVPSTIAETIAVSAANARHPNLFIANLPVGARSTTLHLLRAKPHVGGAGKNYRFTHSVRTRTRHVFAVSDESVTSRVSAPWRSPTGTRRCSWWCGSCRSA